MSGGGSKTQTVGYRYYFGIHMGICRGPVDELVAIRVGDKSAWEGSVTNSTPFFIDNYNLFGGEKGEGGIQGTAVPMFGDASQGSLGDLETMTGTAQPAFRRMFTLFYDGLVTMLNPYPKAWKFRVRRVLKGWDSAVPAWGVTYGRIILTPSDAASLTGYGDTDIHAMNPALIIYECLTNNEWGRGLSPSLIDSDGTFAQTAQTLFSEGFGLCIKWSRKDSISTFVGTILDHIGGVLYTDRSTGKIKLRLIRSDYVRSELPLFTPDTGLRSVESNTVANSGALINEVQVKYRHPVTNEARIVRTDSLGAIKAVGGAVNSTTKNYPGLPTAELALRVAQRDLRSMASSIRRFTFTLDRRGYKVYPGQAIRIADPSHAIPDTVVRVGKIEDDFKSGNVKVTAIQDVFGLPTDSFGGSVGNTWTPPNTTPCVSTHRVFELPYFVIARNTTPADFAYIDPTSAAIGTVCDQGQSLNGSYDFAVRLSAPTPDDNPPDGAYLCLIPTPTPAPPTNPYAGWYFSGYGMRINEDYPVTYFFDSPLEGATFWAESLKNDTSYATSYTLTYVTDTFPDPGTWRFQYAGMMRKDLTSIGGGIVEEPFSINITGYPGSRSDWYTYHG